MATLNKKPESILTHEGAKAKRINSELQLRRSVMACMLWEDSFYEDGESIAKRIEDTVLLVKPEIVANIAIEARENFKLRHVPLLLVRTLAKQKYPVADVLARVIQRPDEITEFLSIYWKDGKCPLSAQVKKGLSKAFNKFNEYQFGKYDRDNVIKLRDALFLSHAKPENSEKGIIFKKIVDRTLTIPDTWEVALSSGKDKKETWERLLKENKLGALALIRNLRNMLSVSVGKPLIKNALSVMKTERVLPFRFISAAKHALQLEPELESAMFKCLSGFEKMTAKTILLVDVSGSMDSGISNKSDLMRLDAACGLAMLLREICEDVEIYTFSNQVVRIPPRRGFALRDTITNSQCHGGTYLGEAIKTIEQNRNYNRIIVITDEQSHDSIPDPKGKGYVINVAAYKNGVGYGAWTHIDGWSESIINYIQEYERKAN